MAVDISNDSKLYAIHQQRKPRRVERYVAEMVQDMWELSRGGGIPAWMQDMRSGLTDDIFVQEKEKAISDLCAERQALVLAGVISSGVQAERVSGEGNTGKFDRQHFNFTHYSRYMNAPGENTHYTYAFDKGGALCLESLDGKVKAYDMPVVSVKDPV